MIILITAVPGSGKTLFSVELIKKYLSEGRTVYSNIDGLSIPSVQVAPDDWRKCPDGSVVVYDECQQMFPPDSSGRSSNQVISDLETHRHRGFDLVLITQHPKLLHSHVRRLVGRHFHLFRMYGSETAKVFRRDGHIDVDKPSSLHAQDSYLWSFPKELYGLYNSATVHTHKRHLPKWMIRGFIFTLLILVVSCVLFYLSFGFFSGKASASEVDQKNKSDVSSSPYLDIPDTVLVSDTQTDDISSSACVWSDKKCMCYDGRGKILNLSYSHCIAVAEAPYSLIASST